MGWLRHLPSRPPARTHAAPPPPPTTHHPPPPTHHPPPTTHHPPTPTAAHRCRSWKIQVRKVLSADKIFVHTGLKQKHETVWRLDQVRAHAAGGGVRGGGCRGGRVGSCAVREWGRRKQVGGLRNPGQRRQSRSPRLSYLPCHAMLCPALCLCSTSCKRPRPQAATRGATPPPQGGVEAAAAPAAEAAMPTTATTTAAMQQRRGRGLMAPVWAAARGAVGGPQPPPCSRRRRRRRRLRLRWRMRRWR